jgi:hypothetical protein
VEINRSIHKEVGPVKLNVIMRWGDGVLGRSDLLWKRDFFNWDFSLSDIINAKHCENPPMTYLITNKLRTNMAL